MGILVGGDKAWKVRKHGELVVAFHWIGSGGESEEPALVLFPAHPSRDAGCVIIGLSSAYKYADSKTGDPTEYLLHQTIPFAKQLGMITTSSLLRKIADVIVDSIPDLVKMPPEPIDFEIERRLAEGRAGEMTIIANGEKVMTAEV